MLYSIGEKGLRKKEDTIASLKWTFQPQYLPIISEFGMEKPFDFELEFDALVKPFHEKGLVTTEDGGLGLTEEGKKWIAESSRILRYRRNE